MFKKIRQKVGRADANNEEKTISPTLQREMDGFEGFLKEIGELLDQVSAISSMKEHFSDFTIISEEGTRFPCHRVFLATKSPVMMAMLSHNMKEKEESEMKLEQKEEVVEHLVDYFYRGRISPDILKEHIDKYLELADLYQLQPLMRQTEKIAIKETNCQNMVDMLVLADLYKAEKLRKHAEGMISRNKKLLKELDLSGAPAGVCAAIIKLIC